MNGLWYIVLGCNLIVAALCVSQSGGKKGAIRFADISVRNALIIGGPWAIGTVAGDITGWCILPLFVAALWFSTTTIGMMNFLVLQWFGVRVARVYVPGRMWFTARREVHAGQLVTDVDVDTSTGRPVLRWTLQRWVWPLTGWWSDFRWIARRT